MNEKLNPIRVKLLKWNNPDSTTLNLNFEKVQPYTSSRDFTKPGFPITIYSDFGYVNITLRGEFIYEKENCWLNEYINDDEIFLEEEVENELTFWEGTHESRYDWTTSYSIYFDYKQIEHLPIDQEEWKKKYSEMTLSWDKLFHERHDILHNDFLSLFIDVTKGKINTLMPDSKNEDLILFKNSLKNNLDSWLESFEEQKKEMEDLYINSTDKTHFKQDNVNSELKGFWKKLIDRFK